MGALEKQKSVKLFCSIIYRDALRAENALKEMIKLFGEVEKLELSVSFDYTDYYHDEMGEPLKRKIVCFKDLVSKESIPQIKHESNRIEDNFKEEERRTVNIDPGYITEAKVVLLTTKDYTHRIYIGKKIFAESTLFYRGGSFAPWPWTYPDYASQELREYFNKVRELYMTSRKTG